MLSNINTWGWYLTAFKVVADGQRKFHLTYPNMTVKFLTGSGTDFEQENINCETWWANVQVIVYCSWPGGFYWPPSFDDFLRALPWKPLRTPQEILCPGFPWFSIQPRAWYKEQLVDSCWLDFSVGSHPENRCACCMLSKPSTAGSHFIWEARPKRNVKGANSTESVGEITSRESWYLYEFHWC